MSGIRVWFVALFVVGLDVVTERGSVLPEGVGVSGVVAG